MLEALAAGLPVAAYPVAGPLDVIGDSRCGVLDEDLGRAIQGALAIPRALPGLCGSVLLRACAAQFLANLRPVQPTLSAAAE